VPKTYSGQFVQRIPKTFPMRLAKRAASRRWSAWRGTPPGPCHGPEKAALTAVFPRESRRALARSPGVVRKISLRGQEENHVT